MQGPDYDAVAVCHLFLFTAQTMHLLWAARAHIGQRGTMSAGMRLCENGAACPDHCDQPVSTSQSGAIHRSRSHERRAGYGDGQGSRRTSYGPELAASQLAPALPSRGGLGPIRRCQPSSLSADTALSTATKSIGESLTRVRKSDTHLKRFI